MLLRLVTYLDTRPDLDFSIGWLFFPQDQAQQYRFPGAVRADQTHPLAGPDEEVDMIENRTILQTERVWLSAMKRFTYIFQFKHLVRPAPAIYRQVHFAALKHRLLDLVHLVKPLLHGLGFSGEVLIVINLSPQRIALDRCFQ